MSRLVFSPPRTCPVARSYSEALVIIPVHKDYIGLEYAVKSLCYYAAGCRQHRIVVCGDSPTDRTRAVIEKLGVELFEGCRRKLIGFHPLILGKYIFPHLFPAYITALMDYVWEYVLKNYDFKLAVKFDTDALAIDYGWLDNLLEFLDIRKSKRIAIFGQKEKGGILGKFEIIQGGVSVYTRSFLEDAYDLFSRNCPQKLYRFFDERFIKKYPFEADDVAIQRTVDLLGYSISNCSIISSSFRRLAYPVDELRDRGFKLVHAVRKEQERESLAADWII